MIRYTQAAGEKVLAEFEADSTHEKVSDLIRSVKDPLSSWLDNKVCRTGIEEWFAFLTLFGLSLDIVLLIIAFSLR